VGVVRFLADADLDRAIVTGCRRAEPTLDFLVASDAGLKGKPDNEVLAIAAAMGRILVTHDLRTRPRHFGDFLIAGRQTPGLFWVHQGRPISPVVESLLTVWAASDAQEWVNRIIEIPL
jgi:predicted nuclease of predicted toxin-antitoxin system